MINYLVESMKASQVMKENIHKAKGNRTLLFKS
jgi:hypothetical protein